MTAHRTPSAHSLGAAMAVAAAAIALTACGSSGHAGRPTPPAGPATGTPSTAAPDATADKPGATGSPASSAGQVFTTTSLDPCALMPPAEASTLTGASYGAGTQRSAGVAKLCIYHGQSRRGVTVEAARLKDASAAAAMWSAGVQQLRSTIDQPGSAFVQQSQDVPGLADKAFVIRATAKAADTVGLSGMWLLKGTEFVSVVVTSEGSESTAIPAMVTEAHALVGRLS